MVGDDGGDQKRDDDSELGHVCHGAATTRDTQYAARERYYS